MGERIWFTTTQAAAHADRHPDTIRDALESKRLHGGQSRPGAHWRIHVDCLDAWLLGVACPHAVKKSA